MLLKHNRGPIQHREAFSGPISALSSLEQPSSHGLSWQAERLLYSLSDASLAADPTEIKRAGGWVEPLADGLESILKFLQTGLDTAHVPYSYGFSIILLTLMVKIITFPLIKQQVESALAVQSLKPRLDLIKQRFGEDKDRISKETSILYEQAGVNPLAGCLPSIATIPIFIGLYSSLSNASQGVLFIIQTSLDTICYPSVLQCLSGSITNSVAFAIWRPAASISAECVLRAFICLQEANP